MDCMESFLLHFFSLSFRCAGVCVSVSEVYGLGTMNKGSDSFFSLLFFYLDGAYNLYRYYCLNCTCVPMNSKSIK